MTCPSAEILRLNEELADCKRQLHGLKDELEEVRFQRDAMQLERDLAAAGRLRSIVLGVLTGATGAFALVALWLAI